MGTKIYAEAIYGFRQDTLANWEAENPILEVGEPAIVSDSHNGEWLKIGDGVSRWSELPWKKWNIGENYTLTEADKLEIANLILADSTDILEVGQKTSEGGEIFNLYKDAEIDFGNIDGISIGKQTIPKNKAVGEYSHAEGVGTSAKGDASHAEGFGTSAKGDASHAEGVGTFVTGNAAHAEGCGVRFTVKISKIEGNIVTVKSPGIIPNINELESIKVNSVIWYETDSANHGGEFYCVNYAEPVKTLGITTANKLTLDRAPSFEENIDVTVFMGVTLSPLSHTEGKFCNTLNIESTSLYDDESIDVQRQHAEGSRTLAMGYASHAEGVETRASGMGSHAEGQSNVALGENSHAEGHGVTASGSQSHAEGEVTFASGEHSHAEGKESKALGNEAHAEGYKTEAVAAAHAEGSQSKAIGEMSHAEGNTCTASGIGSHAEGKGTQALREYAHSEGWQTSANGRYSHAEGYKTRTTMDNTHASGESTIASAKNQFVVGQYNKENPDALFIVGNGTSEENRSNAFEVLKDGRIVSSLPNIIVSAEEPVDAPEGAIWLVPSV